MKKIMFIFLVMGTTLFAKEALKFDSYVNDKKEIVIRVVRDTNPTISNSIEMAENNEQPKEVATNTQPILENTTSENKI